MSQWPISNLLDIHLRIMENNDFQMDIVAYWDATFFIRVMKSRVSLIDITNRLVKERHGIVSSTFYNE